VAFPLASAFHKRKEQRQVGLRIRPTTTRRASEPTAFPQGKDRAGCVCRAGWAGNERSGDGQERGEAREGRCEKKAGGDGRGGGQEGGGVSVLAHLTDRAETL